MTDTPVTPGTAETNRRRLLLGIGGMGVVGLTASACSGGPGSASASTHSTGEANDAGVVAATADIPVGGGKIFTDQHIVVTQPTQGEFKGFTNICPHAQCAVGDVSNGQIICPCHGSRFNISTGAVVDGPASTPLPRRAISVDNGKIRLLS